ncbi:MORN repeat-containing protein [Kordia sp.]|uniref:MORN repeat-containing protein n=1 Tax=Kordia sp. TaxID=1965332 RepID=UPI003B5C59A8
MQRFFLFILCFVVSFSFAQQVKTQKDILNFPNTDLVKDFNLKVKGNIKPITVVKSTFIDIGFGFENKNFNYLKKDYSTRTLTFEGNKLISNSNKFQNAFGKPNVFYFYYSYDDKGVLKSSTSKSSNAGKLDKNDEINEYRFYSNGLIKENVFKGLGKVETLQYSYKNNSLSYTFPNGNTTYHLTNGLITKEVTFNKSANKTFTENYSYNDQGFLVAQQGETNKYTFQLNANNLIEKEIRNNYTSHYKYVYDKYGNWIIAYTLSKGSKGLYGSRFNFYLREIKYSNGETTGGKTPESPNIKVALLKARQSLYDELILGKKSYVAKKVRNVDLGFPMHEIEEDYNLKIAKGNIIPVKLNKKQYDQREKFRSNEIMTELKLESVTEFDPKLKKVKTSQITRKAKTTKYYYNYDDQGRLIKYWTDNGLYGNRFENYSYEGNGNFLRAISFKENGPAVKEIYKKTEYGYQINGQINDKIYTENNLIKKKVSGYNKTSPSESFYTHNDQGNVIKLESKYYTTIKKYNAQGDLEFSKETRKSDGSYTAHTYAYKYDKYGNWIIQVRLLDMSMAKGIPSFPNPTLRQITYSNGKVTGTTDITKVEKDLISLRKKVKAAESNTTSSTGVATWKKAKEDNFYFYIDNKPVQKAQLGYMGDHILAFNQDNNQLYKLENVKNAKINTTYNAQKINVKTAHGYWFKKTNGSVVVFKNNGVVIQKSNLYKYAPNGIDVFYQGEGDTKKVVLQNYKSAKVFTVYPAIDFNTYDTGENTTTNTVAKRSGTCLRGDCDNGYGEFKYASSGKIAKGFYTNGQPNGVILIESANIKDAVFSSYVNSFDKNDAFTYEFDGKNTVYFYDKNLTKGFANDSKKKETYKLIFKNRKVVSKQLLKYNGETGCMLGNCTNGIGVYKYSNGAFYFGTFSNGKRSGFGKIDFSNGTYYIGEFSNGDYNGLGSYTWSEHNFYMGEYKNGKYHGKGVMYYDKTRYDAGTWANGKFQGKVTSTSNSSSTSTSNSNNSTSGFNTFSTTEKSSISACNNDAKCVANYFHELHKKNKSTLSSSELNKKMTNYFHSLYSMNPKLAYNICFKLNTDTFNTIKIKTLPQNVQADLKARAQKLTDGYQKHLKKQGY